MKFKSFLKVISGPHAKVYSSTPLIKTNPISHLKLTLPPHSPYPAIFHSPSPA